MKIGVSSYSYNRARLSVMDMIATTKDIGFDVIEFAGFPNIPEGETKASFAAKVREACSEQGLEMGNYTIGADFLNNSQGWQAEVDRLKEEVDIAKILGAPGMRHDATRGFSPEHKGGRGFDDALPTLIKGCRAVTEYAADQGVKTMVENHGFFCQDSDRVEKLANGVDHPNFGLLVDMGNFLCADEDPAVALGRVMPYAFHVHAKDFHVKSGDQSDPGQGWFKSRASNYLRGAIIGHGNVPILQCLRVMKHQGYQGVLSIEFEGMEEPVNAIKIGAQNLRSYINDV